ncbi:hypothetical protein Cal7507_3111 [Calothrix sp. PCC 7507]|nr:hypothetical protein Cal7507_3111 [Calothrix sp. PCC 7507]
MCSFLKKMLELLVIILTVITLYKPVSYAFIPQFIYTKVVQAIHTTNKKIIWRCINAG